jgi:hypothetical protein
MQHVELLSAVEELLSTVEDVITWRWSPTAYRHVLGELRVPHVLRGLLQVRGRGVDLACLGAS